jgi:hypothetical protein
VAFSQEAVFAGTTCVLLAFPIVILFRGYSRSRNPRMLMAGLAVSSFFGTDFILLLAHMGWIPGADSTELVEFIGDLLTAALLALTFTMRFGGRDASQG